MDSRRKQLDVITAVCELHASNLYRVSYHTSIGQYFQTLDNLELTGRHGPSGTQENLILNRSGQT
jgi:hypothetical protein